MALLHLIGHRKEIVNPSQIKLLITGS